jgi:predicted peptidase
MIMLSVAVALLLSVTVNLKVYEPATVIPVTVLVYEDGVVIAGVAGPETKDHVCEVIVPS